MSDAEKIAALERRIEDLEDVLLELAPFGACHEVTSQTTLSAPNDELCLIKAHQFKRDTLYMNKHVFRKVAKLMEPKLRSVGMNYIFDA